MPVKTENASSKSSMKIFDVSKPGKSAAGATSRPVIIANRPIIKDPMVTLGESGEAKETDSPAAIKVVIKPISETANQTKDSSKTAPKTKDLTIAEIAEEAGKAEKKSDSEVEAASKTTDDKPATRADDEINLSGTTAETESEYNPEEATGASETESVQDSDDSSNLPGESEVALPDGAAESSKEVAALEATAKKKEELDKLVESREFFLPINTAEHRRSKLVGIFGFVLIILLGLLLLNMLLDIGYVQLQGVQPVTNFFSGN